MAEFKEVIEKAKKICNVSDCATCILEHSKVCNLAFIPKDLIDGIEYKIMNYKLKERKE